jgi:hypothetical protein
MGLVFSCAAAAMHCRARLPTKDRVLAVIAECAAPASSQATGSPWHGRVVGGI